MKSRILFILKRREDYNPIKHSPQGLSTGLFNSATFMVDMLNEMKIDAHLEVAIDNNCIDRLVTDYQPTHVIIEALWVVPSKFNVLTKLHPDVKWIVRLHSEMPFMAGEGMAMDWLGDYLGYPQITIGINAPRMLAECRAWLSMARGFSERQAQERIIYMPNFYPQQYQQKSYDDHKYWIDIACFGAVRPLKNHMVQAVAALEFARRQKKQLRFHINAGRIEMQGQSALNNLQGMFQHLADSGHQLIAHEWAPREQFLETCAGMDIGMQCNFSETFNIVSADLISQGVPVVGSREIPWASPLFNARPTETQEIVQILERTHKLAGLNVWHNQHRLTQYTNQSRRIWRRLFKG